MAKPPDLPQILRFDLPPEIGTGDGPASIRGFVVGYFQADSTEPRWMLEVARDLARIDKDGSVRILLPLADLPAGTYTARVKVRAASMESGWSAPSPPFSLPAPRRRSDRPPPKPPRPLNLRPSLAATVKPLLPKDTDLAEATRGFQKPVQFVSALLAARNLDVAFADLKAILFGSSGRLRTLSAAIADLRPDRDAQKEARKALEQARTLIREARRRPDPTPPTMTANLRRGGSS